MAFPDQHPRTTRPKAGARAVESPPNETALVRGLVDGEEWAAVALWSRFGRTVFRIAERGLGSSHEAEDLTQDVFVALFRKIGTLRDPNALRSFVVSVTIRLLKWRLRRKRVRQWIHLTPRGELPELPVQGVDSEQALRCFYRLLGELSVDDQMVFVLRRVDGMPLAEVAMATSLSLATVKRRLVRIDADLARRMEGEPVLVAFLRKEGILP